MDIVMKKLILLCAFLLSACTLKPNDFPPPPPQMTVIVELPWTTPTPTPPAPKPKPIMAENLSDAETFFLILKIAVAAGDDHLVASKVYYPINVKINGQMTTLHNADEFLENYSQVFNQTLLEALKNTSETDLSNLPNGIRVGNGELWFGLFCPDTDCAKLVFLITQINN
jgi:hypothetical protein